MKTHIRVLTVLTGAFVLFAAILFVFGGPADGSKSPVPSFTPTPVPSFTPTPTATPMDFGPQKQPDQCVAGYNIVLDNNEHDRLVSEGIDTSDPQKAVEDVMEYAKHDPRILQIYWNASPLGKKSPVKDVKSLTDDGCYSADGRDIWNRTYTQYKMATVEEGQAPATGINTFAVRKGGTYQVKGAISGDRTAVKVTFPNGDVMYVLKRCGNAVVPAPIPHIPTKPSVKPTPTPTHKPTQSFDQQQNKSKADQAVQDNTTSGVNTGRTSGAPTTAPTPAPTPSTAPTSGNSGGYSSGSTSTGSAPGGTYTGGGTTSTGSSSGSGTVDSTSSGANNGTDGTNSTGGGTITNPFG